MNRRPGVPMRGHVCDGLVAYDKDTQKYSCIPEFDEKGFIWGCHAESLRPITHCPFCGTKLED